MHIILSQDFGPTPFVFRECMFFGNTRTSQDSGLAQISKPDTCIIVDLSAKVLVKWFLSIQPISQCRAHLIGIVLKRTYFHPDILSHESQLFPSSTFYRKMTINASFPALLSYRVSCYPGTCWPMSGHRARFAIAHIPNDFERPYLPFSFYQKK